LQREIEDSRRNPHDTIAMLAAGGSVAEITASAANLQNKIAAKEREIEALRQAQRLAEQEIEARITACDWAARKVARAAADVVARETNIDKLLDRCAKAQETVLVARAQLLALSRAMDDGEGQQRIRAFLQNPWTAEQLGDAWLKRPEAVRVQHWADALKRDAKSEAPPLV
jgi:hypothetical protein